MDCSPAFLADETGAEAEDPAVEAASAVVAEAADLEALAVAALEVEEPGGSW